jgi:hypothetical protein
LLRVVALELADYRRHRPSPNGRENVLLARAFIGCGQNYRIESVTDLAHSERYDTLRSALMQRDARISNVIVVRKPGMIPADP